MNDAVYFEKCDRVFYADRLKTFEHWPKQLTPDKYALAQAGFYYTGVGDKVTCFACNLSLHHWESTDSALREHLKWSKNCTYLRIVTLDPVDVVDKTPSQQSNTAPTFGIGSSVQTTPATFGSNYF